jgi:SAM-dependent methyltransferase
MVAAAQADAAAAGVPNASFAVADAQVDVLGDGTFDAAFSRFGVMFFADPAAAFANVHRFLRRGGRISFVCWQSGLQNEWMLIPGAAALAALGATPPVPDPDEPGPFAFADPGRVTSILEKAGFTSIAIEQRNDTVVTEEDRIPEVARTSSKVGLVRELLRDADDATVQRVLGAIEDAMRARLEGGQVQATRGVNLVSAEA